MKRQPTPDMLGEPIPSEDASLATMFGQEPGQQPNALVKLSAATRALAEARTVDEVKQIMDLAEAARVYAKRANLGLEAQNYAAEIHLDGARKAGELLARLERNTSHGGGAGRGIKTPSDNGQGFSEYRAVLDETGTTRQDANRWQQIASLPQDLYDNHKSQVKARRQELTTRNVLKLAEVVRHQAVYDAMIEDVEPVEIPWLLVGDFRTVGLHVPESSVDLIFTDPPYDEAASVLFDDLAQFAARVLKPGGILLTYSGQLHLPQIYAAMGQHLQYMWTCAIGHGGGATWFRKWHLLNQWKPILMYGKPPIKTWWLNSFADYVVGGKEKADHEWQQALGEALHYIQAVCPPGGVVCDPFLGSGTTLVAAKRLGMQYIGIEKDPATAARAKSRIEGDQS